MSLDVFMVIINIINHVFEEGKILRSSGIRTLHEQEIFWLLLFTALKHIIRYPILLNSFNRRRMERAKTQL